MKEIKYIIFISSSGSGTVINYGSGSDFLTSYGSGSTIPVPLRWQPLPVATDGADSCHLILLAEALNDVDVGVCSRLPGTGMHLVGVGYFSVIEGAVEDAVLPRLAAYVHPEAVTVPSVRIEGLVEG